MSSDGNVWTPKRLKGATVGLREAVYEALPGSKMEAKIKDELPELFRFKAISVGDENGQAFLVPLDESSRETAMYILRAIAAYEGE